MTGERRDGAVGSTGNVGSSGDGIVSVVSGWVELVFWSIEVVVVGGGQVLSVKVHAGGCQ